MNKYAQKRADNTQYFNRIPTFIYLRNFGNFVRTGLLFVTFIMLSYNHDSLGKLL